MLWKAGIPGPFLETKRSSWKAGAVRETLIKVTVEISQRKSTEQHRLFLIQ